MKRIVYSILLTLLISACNNNQDSVVVYTSVDQVFSEPILKDFEEETGIIVKAIYDTEETKSTGVLNRLIAEKDNPQCDLFWSGDPIRTIVLKNKGITTAYESPLANNISSIYKDKDHQWTGFSARARVLIYNKSLLYDSLIPKSIFDLTKPEYKGNFAIANPLFGTTTFHIAAIFSAIGDEKTMQFLEEIKQNKVIIATSNGDVKKRVVNGEIACGLTDTDDAFEAIKEGANIGIVFLDQENNFGSLIMPNTICLIKNSPNSPNAQKLADYLLSKSTEAKLAISCAQMPLHKGVEVPENIPSLDNITPMTIDYNTTALKLEEIQDYIKNWLEEE
jgi:iron(III) transport system substrate-binding protein